MFKRLLVHVLFCRAWETHCKSQVPVSGGVFFKSRLFCKKWERRRACLMWSSYWLLAHFCLTRMYVTCKIQKKKKKLALCLPCWAQSQRKAGQLKEQTMLEIRNVEPNSFFFNEQLIEIKNQKSRKIKQKTSASWQNSNRTCTLLSKALPPIKKNYPWPDERCPTTYLCCRSSLENKRGRHSQSLLKWGKKFIISTVTQPSIRDGTVPGP